jgi:hypothetical protein
VNVPATTDEHGVVGDGGCRGEVVRGVARRAPPFVEASVEREDPAAAGDDHRVVDDRRRPVEPGDAVDVGPPALVAGREVEREQLPGVVCDVHRVVDDRRHPRGATDESRLPGGPSLVRVDRQDVVVSGRRQRDVVGDDHRRRRRIPGVPAFDRTLDGTADGDAGVRGVVSLRPPPCDRRRGAPPLADAARRVVDRRRGRGIRRGNRRGIGRGHRRPLGPRPTTRRRSTDGLRPAAVRLQAETPAERRHQARSGRQDSTTGPSVRRHTSQDCVL